MDITNECKRNMRIKVNDDFINSLENALTNSKAEKLPNDSHYPLYVGTDLMEQMKTNDNQIIWGRRGTGKTHLLKAFNQYINDDPECQCLSYYISCDDIIFETPVSLDFKDDLEKMKYCARETFKQFMYSLIDQIITTYEDIIEKKYYFGEKKETEKKRIKSSCDKYLADLYGNIIEGVPQKIDTNTNESISLLCNKSHSSIKSAMVSISTPVDYKDSKLKLEFGADKERKNIEEIKSVKETSIEYDFSFTHFHNSFIKMIKSLEAKCLYICIDELWLIDEKSSISYQPLFLDYLKRTLFSIPNVSIKIASIRETTKLNSKTTMLENFGLQAGHDIIETANLDSMQYTIDELYEKFLEILWARINYFSEERKNQNKDSIYSKEYIVNTIFKNEQNLNKLISFSHGIPRYFLYAMKNALVNMKYDLSKYYLHSYYLSEVIINIFINEKRSSMPMNDNSIYKIITDYANTNGSNFFLLSTEHSKQFNVDINNLIYVEILHRIPSGMTPNSIMDSYKAYYIDTGKYFSVLKEKDINGYRQTINDFILRIPNDLRDNYEKYIINLDNIPNNYIECHNCGATFNKCHPVYQKYGCCTTCGFKII